jgi:hypothetical protein
MAAVSRRQRHNAKVVLYRVRQRAIMGAWTFVDTRRTARLCLCCVLTESDLWVYANIAVPGSLTQYHEQLGTDHRSVGLYQQQVPLWGTAEQCMDPIRSTDSFVDRLLEDGLTRVESGVAPWDAIQRVQQSAFQDGSNYKAHHLRAIALCERWRSWWTP